MVDLKTRAIAEQLTLMCSQLFQKVELSEVLACAKQYREEQMPNVVAFTRHWNQLSGWVGTQVLRETSDRQLRERTHLKLIKVAKVNYSKRRNSGSSKTRSEKNQIEVIGYGIPIYRNYRRRKSGYWVIE